MNIDFTNLKVLLIGDFMVDHYIIGKSNRLSPEAPVPVIIPHKNFSVPGGAGNVAMNLSILGAKVTCIGVIGDDLWGKKIISMLKKENINTNQLKKIDKHITTLKQRIYIGDKQVLRIDTEKKIQLTDYPKIKNKDYDVVILSDYNKGVLDTLWFDLNSLNNVFVDPKKKSFEHYKNAKIITPNLNELSIACGKDLKNDSDIINECKKLIRKYNFEYIIAKKGKNGMTIIGKNNFVKHIEAHNVVKPDVTGAGDTVIASLSLCYAHTGDLEFSARFANAAASVAVGKSGTSYAKLSEIKNIFFK
jgi:rfaE bifunctional protein kinase chain/domain